MNTPTNEKATALEDLAAKLSLAKDFIIEHHGLGCPVLNWTAYDIEDAVNEQAALVAVAEAANDCEAILDGMDLRPSHQCSATELRIALANLDAVRKGAQ